MGARQNQPDTSDENLCDMSFLIAAPASGSGKTTVTLGLLRALRREGFAIRSAKSGPDYIDPRFHAAACGGPCLNLDAWAMTPDRLRSLSVGDTPLIIEGAMGLFDGAPPDGNGSCADLARTLDIPVVLVIDAGRMAHSIGALVLGFERCDPTISIAGVILNNVGSERHARMLRKAIGQTKVLGALHRNPALAQPSRHLGLIQAQERPDLEAYLNAVADQIAEHCDMAALRDLLEPRPNAESDTPPPPPAQHIAVADDAAFAFHYPHLLQDWRNAGATLSFFSPLADDPVPNADFVYLPGGYPELHAARLASNALFLKTLRETDAQIYGECGGYMVLGETLVDADGQGHAMAGLLPLETSFADRKRHLGYRDLVAESGPFPGTWKGHEFHYATTLKAEGVPLFAAKDAEGHDLPPMGLIQNNVAGSFAHIIDRA